MVHIKKLILENFKSFGGKNEIKFMDKLNLIIGPNGSGKSNISEGISFVLGGMSKKSLRTDKLSHLIYNGGKKGKSAKYALVKLIFSNEDKVFPIEDGFVELSRRVNENGQSEYRINGKKTTRTEILNVLDYAGLNPDGFNMIMQGKIAKLVDMSSIERRELIEQISGISTYENKKKKALKELDKVKEKIKETNIILKEREKHLEELKKEKRQAEKFQNTKKLLKITKGQLVLKQLKNKEKEKKDIEEKIEKTREKIRKRTEETTNMQQKVTLLKSQIDSLNQSLGAQGAEKQKELKEKIGMLKNDIYNNETIIKSHKNEINRIKNRDSQITKNLLNYGTEIKKLENELENYSIKIKEYSEEIKILRENASSNKEIKYFDLKLNINKLKENLIELRRERDSLVQRQENFDNYKNMQEELGHKEELIEMVLKKLESEIGLNSELAIKLEKVSNNQIEFNRIIERINARKNVSIEMAGRGTKMIMQKGINGVQGTVAQLLKVNEKYELPIRVSAGGRLLNIVVNNEDVAKSCIDFLKTNKLGVVTFLPLNKIKHYSIPKGLRTINGVIDYAINMVEFDEKYRNIFEYIFRDTLIVKDFEVAKNVGIGKIRMITLTGDRIEKSGAISGGSRSRKSAFSMLNAKNDEKLKDIEKELAKNNVIHNKIKEMKRENDINIMSMREKRAALNAEIKNLNMLISDLKIKSKGFDVKKLQKVKEGIETFNEELLNNEKMLEEYEKIFNKQNFEKTKKQLEGIEAKLNTLTINKEIKSSRLKQLEEKEVIELKKIKKELDKQRTDFEKEIKTIEKKLSSMTSQLKIYEKEEESFHKKLKENYEKRDKEEEQRKKYLLKLEENKIHINDFEEKINNLNLLIAEVNSKIEGFKFRFEEYKELDIRETRRNLKEMEHEIFLLEKKLERFGNVNMKALDVFKIVEEEYTEVRERMNKLEKENNSVLLTIDDIEGKKASTFIETFNEIRNNFERIFSILSPGGIANLIIESPGAPFEAGIDIKARPKGKKMLTLKSMSGGEKTITALSFVYAIQEYDPAPFYIFDEVDAALDKENATKLGKLCKQYSEKAQFLVISHNDNVISEADYLYGISMDPNGLSKIVTLKLPE